MESILKEIEIALEAKLYYLALAVALSVPDICAGLEREPDKVWVTEGKYIAWFNENLADSFHFFTAEDCYRLRGGVLHTGKLGHPKARYDKLMFVLPFGDNVIHENILDGALQMQIDVFCNIIIETARRWATKNAKNPNVLANLPNVVRYRPHGLKGYIEGLPMIA